MLRERLPDFGVRRQNQKTVRIVSEPQLLWRTHHALGFNATNSADFDGEWFGSFWRRQRGTGQCQRYFVADFVVFRATNYLPFPLSIGDAAKGKFVGIWMLLAGKDLDNDDSFELAAELLDSLHLDSEHGQVFGEFIR